MCAEQYRQELYNYIASVYLSATGKKIPFVIDKTHTYDYEIQGDRFIGTIEDSSGKVILYFDVRTKFIER